MDVADKGSIVISGSRDQLVKVWRLADDDFLSPISTINIGDRIWSLATSKAGCVAVGKLHCIEGHSQFTFTMISGWVVKSHEKL